MNASRFIHLFEELGLNETESKVYLALLELEEALPSSIARRAQVKRPTTYVVLEQLKKRGLVSHTKRNGTLYLRAVSPEFILEERKNQNRRLEEALPELLNLNRRYEVMPQMSVFEGHEGIIQIMEDTLTSSTELLCWCNGDLALKSLESYYPIYLKKKVEKNLWLKGVSTYDQASLHDKKYGGKELREVYLIPKDKYPIQNEINIYDDKVAIISHVDEIGVIIQNKHIADTQRAIFMMCFEYAKILEPTLLTKRDKEYLKDI